MTHTFKLQFRVVGGIEVCSQFKMNPRFSDVPIVFITGDTDVEQRIEAFRAGTTDYIEKPFQTEEVLIRILIQIELSQRRREEKNRIQEDLLHLLSHELINSISSGPYSN